jgi:transposase
MLITAIAATGEISRRLVYQWAQRLLEQGLAGLTDTPGCGHRRVPRQPTLAESSAVRDAPAER